MDLLLLPSKPTRTHSSSTTEVFSPDNADKTWTTVFLRLDTDLMEDNNTGKSRTPGVLRGENRDSSDLSEERTHRNAESSFRPRSLRDAQAADPLLLPAQPPLLDHLT